MNLKLYMANKFSIFLIIICEVEGVEIFHTIFNFFMNHIPWPQNNNLWQTHYLSN
jgi:hypothetical protein